MHKQRLMKVNWFKWVLPTMSVLVTGYFCASVGQGFFSSLFTACIGAGIAIGQFVFLSPEIKKYKLAFRSLGLCLFVFNALGTVGVIESNSISAIEKAKIAKVEQGVALQRLGLVSSEIESMSEKGVDMIGGRFQKEGKKLLNKKDVSELDRDKYLADYKRSQTGITPIAVLLSEFEKAQRLVFWLVLAVLFDLTGIGFFYVSESKKEKVPDEDSFDEKTETHYCPMPDENKIALEPVSKALDITIKSDIDYQHFKTRLVSLEFGEFPIFNEVKASLKIGASKLQRFYQSAKQENLLDKEGNRWKVIQCED